VGHFDACVPTRGTAARWGSKEVRREVGGGDQPGGHRGFEFHISPVFTVEAEHASHAVLVSQPG
jgi:hypothetical protein